MSISDKVIEILKSRREYVKRINRVENEISKAITNSKEAYSKFLALENGDCYSLLRNRLDRIS